MVVEEEVVKVAEGQAEDGAEDAEGEGEDVKATLHRNRRRCSIAVAYPFSLRDTWIG